MNTATVEMPKLMNPDQTAEVLGVTVETLSLWRCTKRYPLAFVKIGKCVKYRADDVLAFIESRTVNCTAA